MSNLLKAVADLLERLGQKSRFRMSDVVLGLLMLSIMQALALLAFALHPITK